MDKSIRLSGHPLLLRCDATPETGVGHLMRCLALGEAWQAYGGNVTVIGHVKGDLLRNRIYNSGAKYVPLDGSFSSSNELDELYGMLLALRDSEHSFTWHPWLVLDGYHFDTAYQSAVRKQGYSLCVVDDFAHLDFYDADVLLNQNIGADALVYHYLDSARTLFGPDYAMLRSQFLAGRESERSIPEQASNILVTFGGSDLKNQIPKVLRALGEIENTNLTVNVVLGFDFRESDEFRQALNKASRLHKVELLRGVEDMPRLMAWADLAISAGGSTTYEIAFMGVPMILIAIADNQLGIVQGLHEAGVAVSLGWYEDVLENSISWGIARVCESRESRRELCKAGQMLVDGHGCKRILNILAQGTTVG